MSSYETFIYSCLLTLHLQATASMVGSLVLVTLSVRPCVHSKQTNDRLCHQARWVTLNSIDRLTHRPWGGSLVLCHLAWWATPHSIDLFMLCFFLGRRGARRNPHSPPNYENPQSSLELSPDPSSYPENPLLREQETTRQYQHEQEVQFQKPSNPVATGPGYRTHLGNQSMI